MAKLVALLRGIAPAFPNMKNEDLRRVFEALGFVGVSSVLSSGNILFEAPHARMSEWEQTLEAAWPVQLGFKSTTIIRSQKQLSRLLAAKPFANLPQGRGLPIR